MKWWNRRKPEDLVGGQVDELARRDAAERGLITPQSIEQGTSWADRWHEHVRANMRPHAGAVMPLIVEAAPDQLATGGWRAPSETLYGLLDLPQVQTRRGGIRFLTEAERDRVASAGVLAIPQDVTFPR